MRLLQRNKPAYLKWLIKLAGQDDSLIREIAKNQGIQFKLSILVSRSKHSIVFQFS